MTGLFAMAGLALALTASSAPAKEIEATCQVWSGKDSLVLTFVFDTSTNTAYMVGNNGRSEVYGHYGESAATFLEFLPTGVVQSTTINSVTHEAVHSQHSVIGAKTIPSQFRGKCY